MKVENPAENGQLYRISSHTYLVSIETAVTMQILR